MTKAEKLETLIEKAIELGFKPKNFSWIPEDKQALIDYWFTANNYKSVIFDHDFARALFGKERIYIDLVVNYVNSQDAPQQIPTERWQFHLQQAVISDDPIGYMYGVVFG